VSKASQASLRKKGDLMRSFPVAGLSCACGLVGQSNCAVSVAHGDEKLSCLYQNNNIFVKRKDTISSISREGRDCHFIYLLNCPDRQVCSLLGLLISDPLCVEVCEVKSDRIMLNSEI
jgi:hypothetical protein